MQGQAWIDCFQDYVQYLAKHRMVDTILDIVQVYPDQMHTVLHILAHYPTLQDVLDDLQYKTKLKYAIAILSHSRKITKNGARVLVDGTSELLAPQLTIND